MIVNLFASGEPRGAGRGLRDREWGGLPPSPLPESDKRKATRKVDMMLHGKGKAGLLNPLDDKVDSD